MKKLNFFILSILFLIGIVACSQDASKSSDTVDDYPNSTLNVVIPFGPGGGTDLYLRKIIEIIQQNDLYDGDIKIENREGGSGATGWGFLATKDGDPYYLGPTSGSFFTTPLVSETQFNYESFTPVALMGADDLFLLVNSESEYMDLEDFINAANNKRMKIGGVGQVSDEMIVPTMFAQEAEFEFDYVPFQGAGELTSALLSDSLDAIVGNPARSLGQIKGDVMRPLAFSALERLPQLPNVPTFTELGYDVNLSQPRGVILPGDIDPDIKDWWVDVMKEVAETDEWQEYITENGMSNYTLFGDDFADFLEETHLKFENALDEVN